MTRVESFAGRRIAVIGDVMLDHFLIGRANRISPEAPVPVLHLLKEEFRLGGAGNVASNVRALGGAPTLVGLIGRDEGGTHLRTTLRAAGIDASGLVEDATRPTTEKLRAVTARNQQVARIDRESTAPAAGDALNLLTAQVSGLSGHEAIVLSDYSKGAISAPIVAAAISAAAGARCPLLVDPKVPDAAYYRGATLITPNHHEAELMTGISIVSEDDARTAARRIHELCGASVLITWGEHGMWALDTSAGSAQEAALPAAAREVSDVTGAGDTVIATLALALASGARLIEAAQLANFAAGIVVGRFGPATVTAAELMHATDVRPRA
jgi:rfaE bifunctional protein kinase chain/domain